MSHPVTEEHAVQGETVRLRVGPLSDFDGEAADVTEAVLRWPSFPHVALTAEDDGGSVVLTGTWTVPADAPVNQRQEGQVWVADSQPVRVMAVVRVVVSAKIPEANGG